MLLEYHQGFTVVFGAYLRQGIVRPVALTCFMIISGVLMGDRDPQSKSPNIFRSTPTVTCFLLTRHLGERRVKPIYTMSICNHCARARPRFGTSSSLCRVHRWVNLWPPEDFVTDFTQLSTTRRLQEAADGAAQCMFAEARSGDIGAIVCAGNIMLLSGILLFIFLVHVTVASGVQAYWLTKVTPAFKRVFLPGLIYSRCVRLQLAISGSLR